MERDLALKIFLNDITVKYHVMQNNYGTCNRPVQGLQVASSNAAFLSLHRARGSTQQHANGLQFIIKSSFF